MVKRRGRVGNCNIVIVKQLHQVDCGTAVGALLTILAEPARGPAISLQAGGCNVAGDKISKDYLFIYCSRCMMN